VNRKTRPNLRLHFEAVSQLASEDQQTELNVIDGLMIKHQTQAWTERRKAVPTAPPKKPVATQRAAVKRRAAK